MSPRRRRELLAVLLTAAEAPGADIRVLLMELMAVAGERTVRLAFRHAFGKEPLHAEMVLQ